jgi:formylglycine-generating enzyme required for sulfatase activity
MAKKELKRPLSKMKKEQSMTFTNSIAMEFMLIPAGEFTMGPDEYKKEQSVHKVKIPAPFYLGIYPVTQCEWNAVMGFNPSSFKGDDLPVEQVSWDDVRKFIIRLNKKEGTMRYRLPSEAEWEYACRAGSTTRYSFGDDESELDEYAWYIRNSGLKTHPVGQKKPNPWGLYDMHGNVWEWVQDTLDEDCNSAPTFVIPGFSADGVDWHLYRPDRIFRGGSWNRNARCCSSNYRCSSTPPLRDSTLGFRLVRDAYKTRLHHIYGGNIRRIY